MDVSKQLVFGRIGESFRDSLYQNGVKLMKKSFWSYGLSVASYIKKWMDKDNYKQTRTMSKFLFTLISREDGSRHHLTWMESTHTGKSEH
jgi:hypothetical protein